MNMTVRYTFFAAALVALLALPVYAQGMMTPWDMDGDVDGDGMVGPTDVQQVVNQALGLSDEGPAAVNRLRRQFVVASPRASLALKPGITAEEAGACDTIGAAYNFPRQNARMLVKTGTTIYFRYDRNVEGVWYEGACGLLRTGLKLAWAPLPEVTIQVFPPEVDWQEAGEDQAEGRTCGPKVGTAAIYVAHAFAEAGDYVVRANATTVAVPEGELSTDVARCGAAYKSDNVYIHVRVIDDLPTPEELQWFEGGMVDPIFAEFGSLMRHNIDETLVVPEEE